MNNSTSGLTRDCDLSSGCYKTLHCNGTHIVVHFGGSFAHACMRVRSWLSLCMSVPVSLCPFCHPSSSHLFRRQLSVRRTLYVYDCVQLCPFCCCSSSVSGGHFFRILAARVCERGSACVCALQSLDIGIPLSH